MKHIKFRILIIVWSSMILLFFAFAGILNIVLPSHFVSEAEDALEYEIDYQNYISNSNGESEDDSSDYYEEDSNEESTEESTLQKKFESGYQDSYFTSDIYYIDVTDALNDKNTSEGNSLVGSNSTSLKSTYELTEWVKNHNISEEQIYTLQTDNGYYVFTVYEEPQNYDYWDDAESDENDSPVYLMYINIDHIVKYTRSLNWLISAIFLCAIVVMSIIGYRLGVKIEESQKTQRRFFQNSSHELKTPLMAIQGYAEGIEMDVVDPQNAAGIIMQETERMTGLVEEILSISKIDSRHFKLDLVKLDIKEVLYDCFRSLDAVQQMNGISIVPEFPDEEIYVKCDEDQMASAFRNIIINGLKYSKKKITVACETNQKYVYIRFKDDGNGINRDDIEHIFDRFYKGSDGGTGIGLSLANEIIHLHKGSVTAYNYLDGAVFEVKLPIID